MQRSETEMPDTRSRALPPRSAVVVVCFPADRARVADSLAQSGFDLADSTATGADSRREDSTPAEVATVTTRQPGILGGQISAADTGPGVVIVLSEDASEAEIGAAVRSHASCVGRNSTANELSTAVLAAMGNRRVIAGPAANRVMPRSGAEQSARLAALSARELEVLELVASGLTNHEIAAKLYISPKTVKNHVAHILQALTCRNRVEAAVIAVQASLSRD